MLKLGKTPARPGAMKLRFSSYFDRSLLPTPPVKFGHPLPSSRPWGMLANDDYSDCVFAGAAHETMMWTYVGTLGKAIAQFSNTNVLADYAAVTGFDPHKPETDQGTDMVEAANYRRKVGVVDMAGVRHKVDSFVSIEPGNGRDLALAAYLCNAVGVGLRFPGSAMDQFDHHQPWTVVKGAEVDGGHYVPCVGRNSGGDFLVVTWGRIHAMTVAFFEKYCDEAVAYISAEGMRQSMTPEGFDAATLAKDLAHISA